MRPESLEGTDEEDPITALEWDPLSTDYLLVANLHYGIRLVDSESLCCITTFNFPSAAASVQCLAWVHSAPGMFVTGGKFTLLINVSKFVFYGAILSCAQGFFLALGLEITFEGLNVVLGIGHGIAICEVSAFPLYYLFFFVIGHASFYLFIFLFLHTFKK